MENTHDIAQLIRKHLEDSLAPGEQARLALWVDSAPENRAYFERIESGDAVLEDLRELHQLLGHEETPWPEVLTAKLREEIGGTRAPSKGIPLEPRSWRVPTWRDALPYAAAVAILLTVGWLLLVESRQSSVDSLAATEILPGGNRATLTLADGRVVDLSSEQSGIIIGAEDITYDDGSSLEAVILSGEGEVSRGGVEGSLPNSDDTPAILALTTPKGGTYQITLPDGSKVWLNANSTLKYPSRFTGDSREVILEGEAYFDIKKIQGTRVSRVPMTSRVPSASALDAGARVSRVPFKVRTSTQTVEVLGTEFNISAYADDPETKTTLVEGRVRVRGEGVGARFTAPDNAGVTLAPGQQATTRNAATTIQEVDVNQYTAWKSGKFIFTGKPFGQVMAELARWYDLEVVYDGPVPDITFFGGIHRNNNLSAVLKVLESAQIRYTVQPGNRLVIHHNTNGKEVPR